MCSDIKDKVLCANCAHWVNCSNKKKIYGFCLYQDLFTYTNVKITDTCIDFIKGDPLTEKEYENYNKGN